MEEIKLSRETANKLSILLDNLLLNAFDIDLSSSDMDNITNIKAEIDTQLDK